MTENRRFYYLKLKENFYNSETMVILESMQDGLLYSNLLLKMYLMSLKSSGVLLLNDCLPHTMQTIATFTRHQVGTVERALKIFQEFGLVEILTDGAYYMSDIQLLIGQSSSEGERKKKERMRLKRQNLLPSGEMDICPSNSRVDKCPPILEYRDKEIRDKSIENREGDMAHAFGRYRNVFLSSAELAELQTELPSLWEHYIERLSEYMESSGKGYKPCRHNPALGECRQKERGTACPEPGLQRRGRRNHMIEITAEVRAAIDKAAGDMELAGEEYIEPADGLIHCKKCHGSRQTVVPRFGGSGYFMPRCLCPCQQKAQEERKAMEEQRERMERIQRRKAQGLQDRYLYDYTFANDNGQNPVMEKAYAYAEHWKEAYRDNTGLLLFGDVGTGKSFFAGCIANALLDREVPVLMTNFPSILNRLTGVFAEDRAAFIASLDDYSLLVIDDLGVERSTEYAMEQMFTVIDSRYRSKKPLIVTTNLKLEEIKNPPDLAHARIYDRILERCAPVLFSGKNFREEGARATKAAAKEIVRKDNKV